MGKAAVSQKEAATGFRSDFGFGLFAGFANS
jgi:hypothetical protein